MGFFFFQKAVIIFDFCCYIIQSMKQLLILLLYCVPVSLAAQDSSFIVQTAGRLPFLEYGPGNDRLGGAKMTYLDSGIVLKVVDSLDGDYIVRLSKQHQAFIAKEHVKPAPEKFSRPYYLTNNWRVYGDDTFDYVTINLDERLPYRSIQQINPSRIVVDIFGATSNSNWITHLKSAKEVKSAWYEQTEDDVMRVFIELKNKQHWGHYIRYDSIGQRLTIRVKRQPPLDIQKMTIAIDAGHGGANTGAAGVSSGILEKDYTLRIAKELNTLLKQRQVKTLMTRDRDTTLEMADRVEILRAASPDVLISIHLNSSGNMLIQGTSTYYRYIGYKELSQSILNRMLELKLLEIGAVGGFNFALNGPTEYPNCLVEVAFLSNLQDEKRILDPKFHKAVAQKIYAGINDWIKKIK